MNRKRNSVWPVLNKNSVGGKVSMCEYLPHINSSFVDLRTEDVMSSYTELDTVCLPLRDWCSSGWISLAVEIPGSLLELASGAPAGRFPHSARAQGVGSGPAARGKTAM
jgi:hypothetical protein